MPIIKWRPFRELEKPFEDLEKFFSDEEWIPFVPTFPFRAEEPAVDIYQDKDNLYVEMPLAGIKPEDVEISVEDDVLTIQGKSEEKKEIKEKDYFRKEIRRGAFKRVIKLPVEVKAEKAKAESKDGMLKITLPKVTKTLPKGTKIPVKVK